MNSTIKKILSVILVAISLINLLFPILSNFHIYTDKFDPKAYEVKYNNSQYVIPQSKHPISDEELLSYAGYRYATGLNPILINSDHPPLGKYLIGWFTLLTGNNRVVSLFFGLGVILIVCFAIWLLTKSFLLVTLGLFMLSVDTVLLDQIIYSPVLDIIQVFFLMLYILFFIYWLKYKKMRIMILMGLSLGAFASVKIYFPAIILLGFSIFFLFIIKKPSKQIVTFFLTNILLSFIIYTVTYASFFLHGNSIRAFFGAQKWIFLFWKNNSINTGEYFGNIVPLVLFNKWHVWWGTKGYISFVHWSIFWPLFFILGVLSSIFLITKKKSKQDNHQAGLLLSLWVIIAVAYLMFIPVSPRYLMIIYCPMYITIAIFIKRFFPKYV